MNTEPIKTNRAMRRQLERDNAKQPDALRRVPESMWPDCGPPGLVGVFRSKRFLVQEYAESERHIVARLTVNRTSVSGDRWKDGISWDELQSVKTECGYGDFDAVEIYPPDEDIVNVGNCRHLWILAGRLSFAWRKRK